MKTELLAVCALLISIASYAQGNAGEKETLIRRYFTGYEKKDWSMVASVLAADFTFTSPAPDDHIPLAAYKAKCWPQAAHIRSFEVVRLLEKGNEALAIMEVNTMEGKLLRNVEFFTFEKGKIKAIEVFFGGTGAGYPTNAK